MYVQRNVLLLFIKWETRGEDLEASEEEKKKQGESDQVGVRHAGNDHSEIALSKLTLYSQACRQ